MKNIDANGHVSGRSQYVDDIPVIKGTLYGAVFAAFNSAVPEAGAHAA